MAVQGGFPKWLIDSKEHITRGGEWSQFIEELYDAIQQQLKESHVQSFTDLTDAERTLFMERATKAIHGGKAYRDLYGKVSLSMDQHLNNEVAKQLMEDYPINTKTDLILDCAQEGAVSILKKWPDMKSKLHICFNQPLPKPIRQLAWRLFLENAKVRKKYIDMMASNVRACVSPLDVQISQKCEGLILSEPSFEDLKGSIGAFYGMKAVLSYHHALKKSKVNLPDMDYLLMVPFIFNASPNLSRREPAASHVVTLLVEEYLSFMEGRPGFVIDSGSDIHEKEMRSFCGKVAKHLQDHSPDVAKAVSKAFVPNKEKIVATESGSKEILADGVRAIARPVIRGMFVGYCNMEVVLFIWDQYMISLDTAGFHDEYLPAVTAIFLTLLKDAIVQCNSPAEFEKLKGEAIKLTVPQFQYEMNKSYYKKLYPKLKNDDKAALPVLDPTQANYPPWINWFSDKIPNRTTPAERRKAREEREGEKQRIVQQQREEERLKREQDERERRQEEERLFEQQIQDKQRHEEERLQLEDELDAEKRRRADAERLAAAQIEDLRREIEELRQQKAKQEQRPTTGLSLASSVDRHLIPPPNTAASGYSRAPATPLRMSKFASPPPSLSPEKQAKSVVTDFLKRVSQSYNKIAQGDGYLREELDEDTKNKILQHRDDVREAEVVVFGRQLVPGDWDKMSLEERQQRADEIMDHIRNAMQERRARELEEGTANRS